MTKAEERYPLPYYAKMEILLRIIDELRGTKNLKDISTIYRNIKADSTSKTFGLKLGRFLELIESDKRNAWLTDLGYRFSMLSDDKKKILLAENLPSYYITFLKWIKDSEDKSMDMDSLKADILKSFKNWQPSPRVLHESLLTFGDVADYSNLLIFTKGSKGSKSRFQLSDEGLQLLSGIKPSSEVKPEETKRESKLDWQPKEQVVSELPKEAHYPLIIQTRENKLDFDMTNEADWEMVKFMIDKLKAKWEEYEQYLEDSKEAYRQEVKTVEKEIEETQQGESAEDETGDES